MQLSVSTNACSLTLLRLRSKFFSDDIQNYHLKLEEDKNRLEQARAKQEYERERALEAARLAEQNKEKDFKANIPLKRKCA